MRICFPKCVHPGPLPQRKATSHSIRLPKPKSQVSAESTRHTSVPLTGRVGRQPHGELCPCKGLHIWVNLPMLKAGNAPSHTVRCRAVVPNLFPVFWPATARPTSGRSREVEALSSPSVRGSQISFARYSFRVVSQAPVPIPPNHLGHTTVLGDLEKGARVKGSPCRGVNCVGGTTARSP
ncbi:MAG: hypothetical protein KatS3mg077_2871 [Candidatus Binatia bacterium]|nr:MAG: hypothetical protein KatS3mg077_2871 [Candidatus Binatia bacterium]